MKKLILDLDLSVSPTDGHLEGTAYNGYFECTCYHPLFCFNQNGDLERAWLRNGNVHTAQEWRVVLEPVIARYREWLLDKFSRADAGFVDIPEYVPSHPETNPAIGSACTSVTKLERAI